MYAGRAKESYLDAVTREIDFFRSCARSVIEDHGRETTRRYKREDE